jgi:DNA-binding transcriptional ArsR family regulator
MSAFIEDFQVAILKALAHPTRLQIVMKLQQGTKCVTDIHEILPASQANISQHLTILRNAEIVDFTQDGSQRCYYICRPELVAEVLDLLQKELPGDKQQAPQCSI